MTLQDTEATPASAATVRRTDLARLHQDGLLGRAAYRRALELAGLQDLSQHWYRAVDTALGFGGVALLACGVGFFFASNWAAMPPQLRFALLAAGIVAAAGVAIWRCADSIAGQASLFLGAALVGVLLAVYGQTYHSGADPYGLFTTWLVIVTPWSLAARGRALWLLWLVLANLALAFYWIEMVSPRLPWLSGAPGEYGAFGWFGFLYADAALALTSCGLNVGLLAAHEWAARRQHGPWIRGRVVARTAATLASWTLAMAAVVAIIDFEPADPSRVAAPLAFMLLTGAGIAYYLLRGRDLYILALLYLATIVVTTVALAAAMAFDAGAYLLLAPVVAGLATGAALLLRKHARCFADRDAAVMPTATLRT